MLENYGFPWGNKRKLQWALEASDKALKLKTEEAARLWRDNYKLQDELHEVHIHRLLPLADQAADMARMSVFIDDLIDIKEEVLTVRITIPHFRIRKDSAMDYTKRAVYRCAYMLADKLVDRISWELRSAYYKLRGDKGDF